jgi:hypothetical protein
LDEINERKDMGGFWVSLLCAAWVGVALVSWGEAYRIRIAQEAAAEAAAYADLVDFAEAVHALCLFY